MTPMPEYVGKIVSAPASCAAIDIFERTPYGGFARLAEATGTEWR